MRYTGIKGKAWEAVKRWCRRTYQHCYTCGSRDLVSFNHNAGHCWPVAIVGNNNTLSWDERQIRAQCMRCNGPGQGMQEVFIARLMQELGADAVRQLRSRVYKVDPVKDWKKIIEHFDAL